MRLLQGILISLLLIAGSLATDVSSLSDAEVEQIAITALQQAAGLIDLQEEAIKGDNDGNSGVAGPNSQKATNDSITIQKKGDLLVSASQLLVEQYGEAILERLATLDVDALIDKAGIKLADEHARRKRQYGKGGTSQDESDACLPKPSPRNFRSISGWCNNLKNPSFGSTMSTLRRLLKPAYQDGLNQPRLKMQSGRPLKSARLISNEIMQDTREESIYDPKPMEHLYMLFGQFIAHDVILMPTATNKNGTALDCSACNSGDLNANCAPIQIPADDPYFPTRTAKREPACMRLARGINGQNGFGSRIQLNQNSHHLDLSDVYGSTECVAKQLRTFSGGQMKTYTFSGYQLPPQDKNSSPKYYCFLAGDLRNSLHPGLIVLHTAFLKQHNTIASGLQKLKPTLSDEQLYQTARRIIIAWYQNIVYGEYLPQLLGTDFMTKFGLNLSPNAYFRGYDDSVNAATSADFTTAAFRFGHSQARTDHWRTNNANASVATPLNHGNNTFYADQNYDVPTGEVRSLAEGFQSVPTRRMDRYFSFSMRNQLFEIRSKQGSGVDLAAVNIQRGREVGLPPYNDFRQLAGLSRARDWTDFTNIPTNEINKIKTMYDGPNDVDLYVGILSENRVRGGLIGQTGAYIIGEQFRAFKTGDRYYFENQNSTNYEAFTLAQLNQIRTLTLHKLLCANFQGMNNVRKSFDFTQGRQACSSLPAFDVNVFANANWAVAPTRSPSRGTSPKPPPNDGHRDDGRQQDHNGGGGRGGHGGGHH